MKKLPGSLMGSLGLFFTNIMSEKRLLSYFALFFILISNFVSAETLEEKQRMEKLVNFAAQITPSSRQLAWQEMELTTFIHYGLYPFHGRKGWDPSEEGPKMFNPTQMDVRQWARVCKDTGIKMVILTAKNHDGFCLWPSKFTDRSVKNSPWKDGKGDVVKELADACREMGLKFGVYLSPWDQSETSYGDSVLYNEFFKNQLTELLTNYGKISEVWFDGACGEGPNGKKQVYDWAGYYELIRRLQPNAIIANVGPDVRWVGTESGYGRETEWSVLALSEKDYIHIGTYPNEWKGTEYDLGSREKLKEAVRLTWWPAETCVSIRPNWMYYKDDDNKVKTVEHLLDIYYSSVGRNGVLLLNFPPDTRGLIHETDALRARQLRAVLDVTFKHDFALKAKTTSSHIRGDDPVYAPNKIVDGDKETYWSTDDGQTAATVEFDLGSAKTFNRAMLQEYIKLGQRVEEFVLEAWDGNNWKEFTRGTTIGYKRLLRFPDVTAQQVRLRINQSRLCPTISNFGLYKEPLLKDVISTQ